MRLLDLEKFNPITIQCHDNPDADTMSSGFALYCYFKSKHKDVKLIYSGHNQINKKNMLMMKDNLHIPIEYYIQGKDEVLPGLLITVDCQYGSGNVTKLAAEQVAIIDHHPQECYDVDLCRIQTNLGSCATLVWTMLREEGYPVKDDIDLGTALYYGLYMDTNQFAELFHPLDMDMRDALSFNQNIIMQFRYANLSLKELEIAGVALIRCNYNAKYHFAVIKVQPCDPNILGLISDFLLQVEEIDSCIVYNELNEGYKISIRSCTKAVKANEMAAFLTEEIGSGGGKEDKAGGFISQKLYEEKYSGIQSETYFANQMRVFFENYIVIRVKGGLDLSKMQKFRRKKQVLCYIKAGELGNEGEKVSLRSEVSSFDFSIGEKDYFVIDRDGSFQEFSEEGFKTYMEEENQVPPVDYCKQLHFIPTVKYWKYGEMRPLMDFAKTCVPTEEFWVYAKRLDNCVKVVLDDDDNNYLRGMPGEYLLVGSGFNAKVNIKSEEEFLAMFEPLSL